MNSYELKRAEERRRGSRSKRTGTGRSSIVDPPHRLRIVCTTCWEVPHRLTAPCPKCGMQPTDKSA